MNTKVLIGGLLGGIVFFLVGGLLYGLLLASMFAKYAVPGTTKAEADISLLFLGLGNLGFGLLFAHIFSKWASISTFGGGLSAGAIIGALMAFSFDCTIFATANMMNSFSGVLLDVVTFTVISALAGGVIGWWLGRK